MSPCACAAPRECLYFMLWPSSACARVVGGEEWVASSFLFVFVSAVILGDNIYHFAGMLVQCTPTVRGSESVPYKQNRSSLIYRHLCLHSWWPNPAAGVFQGGADVAHALALSKPTNLLLRWSCCCTMPSRNYIWQHLSLCLVDAARQLLLCDTKLCI